MHKGEKKKEMHKGKAEINILLNGSLYGLSLPVKSIFMEAFTALNTSEIRSLSYLLFKTCLLKLQQVILQLDTWMPHAK